MMKQLLGLEKLGFYAPLTFLFFLIRQCIDKDVLGEYTLVRLLVTYMVLIFLFGLMQLYGVMAASHRQSTTTEERDESSADTSIQNSALKEQPSSARAIPDSVVPTIGARERRSTSTLAARKEPVEAGAK